MFSQFLRFSPRRPPWDGRSPSHPETSVALQDISLIQHSDTSQPGPTNALAGVRIRLSPSDFGYDIGATADAVPPIALVAK